MQVNSEKSSACKLGYPTTAETDSENEGLVSGLLNSVLDGRKSAVFVPNVDNAIQELEEKSHKHDGEATPATKSK